MSIAAQTPFTAPVVERLSVRVVVDSHYERFLPRAEHGRAGYPTDAFGRFVNEARSRETVFARHDEVKGTLQKKRRPPVSAQRPS